MQHINPDLLKAYFDGRCTLQEQKQVENWLCQDAGLPDADPDLLKKFDREALKDNLWQQVAPVIQESSPVVAIKRGNRFRIILAAACVLAAAVTYGLLQYEPGLRKGKAVTLLTYVAPPGKVSVVHLADSSIVELNAGAILKYPETFSDADRSVMLEAGEAFFAIADGRLRPFTVQIGDAEVKVLGTKFNIRRQPDQQHTAITLVEGKVRFIAGQQSRILHPGEQLLYNRAENGITGVEKVNVQQVLNWREGIILFNETPLPEVFVTLGNYYGVRFILKREPGADMLFTARFNNQSLSDVLHLITLSTGMHYSMQGNVITME